MKTEVSVAQADWLKADATRKVIAALEAARPSGARFVGGCVRNTLMGHPVSDIDIATQLLPDQTIAACNAAGIKTFPTGIEHGTITAVCDHIPFEITTLRRDVETDGRRAVVAFTEDWAEDAQRRDFRLNALYADADGIVYDPTGGLADISTGQIVFIGEAEQRLREDHLRNLRFFRFNAWYGAGFDATGLAACQALRDGLHQIAAERIWTEFYKLLKAPAPFEAIRAMIDTGVMSVILPECDEVVTRLTALQGIEAANDFRFDAMQRLMCLLRRDRPTAIAVAKRLKVSKAERERLVNWAKAAPPPDEIGTLPVWLYRHSDQAGLDIIAWEWAEHGDREDDSYLALWQFARNWTRPEFPLRGADLLAVGIETGPDMGTEFRRIEDLWIENGFSLDGLDDPLIRSVQQLKR